MARVNWFHCSIDCSTFSWASLSNTGYRSVEGAALTVKAISADRMLDKMLRLSDRFIAQNTNILITFESPDHGSFKSNGQVQRKLLESGWWLARTDYCSAASAWLDGDVWTAKDGVGLEGAVWPRKTTVLLFYGLGDVGCQPLVFPRCQQGLCRMIVPGHQHHARVLCSRSERLQSGQQRVEGSYKSLIPKGLFLLILELYEQWQAQQDEHTSWCLKCSEGGDDLLMCDDCPNVQHRQCQKLCDPDEHELWLCDMCYLRWELSYGG